MVITDMIYFPLQLIITIGSQTVILESAMLQFAQVTEDKATWRFDMKYKDPHLMLFLMEKLQTRCCFVIHELPLTIYCSFAFKIVLRKPEWPTISAVGSCSCPHCTLDWRSQYLKIKHCEFSHEFSRIFQTIGVAQNWQASICRSVL